MTGAKAISRDGEGERFTGGGLREARSVALGVGH